MFTHFLIFTLLKPTNKATSMRLDNTGPIEIFHIHPMSYGMVIPI